MKYICVDASSSNSNIKVRYSTQINKFFQTVKSEEKVIVAVFRGRSTERLELPKKEARKFIKNIVPIGTSYLYDNLAAFIRAENITDETIAFLTDWEDNFSVTTSTELFNLIIEKQILIL